MTAILCADCTLQLKNKMLKYSLVLKDIYLTFALQMPYHCSFKFVQKFFENFPPNRCILRNNSENWSSTI